MSRRGYSGRSGRSGSSRNAGYSRYSSGGRAHFRKRRFNASSPLERVLILLVIAVVIGISVGIGLPKVSPDVGKLTGEYAASGPAADALNRLTVNDSPVTTGYDRDLFGYRKTDDDGNGCDARDDVLARDMTDVTYTHAGGCTVKTGVLDDPYTGETIHFVRGQKTSSAVQIDHVVALENAWQSGASMWDSAKRYRYGNDMYNLLAVDGTANQGKGSSSAAYWLPTNGAFRCDYVARQIGVKAKYELSVTTAEKRAMLSVLRSCPSEQLP
ncbi:HNH endonuclease family protein [Bifidobacterium scardovii]|uniref:Deoxyribonuclease n=1 Tax=Bifidobacterium scardovii TaxID=158787 RepID=A0A087D343_9BIFI|nr:HNH endonuclease family protein [Bifidobacterium scardovii]KFI89943.1 deoxyribonuclease [Bifidobacterium scardovii]MDK6350669.1 HNH endonuclease family protein [Bifidobacterium scardovii]MDU8982888.1 HNH endonuclease family protein [Bifidobacterium scardovii]BAQ32204.1 conserved hypothetical protein [Bifidobacterium scardovii JCM 12489 = DSM 13734]